VVVLVRFWSIFSVFLVANLIGCSANIESDRPEVVATSPYLGSAVREFLGDSVKLASFCGPGACPGHFDIRPSQIEQARSSRLFLRFTFQAGLDQRLVDGSGKSEVPIVVIRLEKGMGHEDAYQEACQQVGDALVKAGLIKKEQVWPKLERISFRLNAIFNRIRAELKEWADCPVLTSSHQTDFCRSIGLNVVGDFVSTGITPSDLNELVVLGEREKVKAVIANRPEGTRIARRLAERLGAKLIVFENVPDPEDSIPFDSMVARNADYLKQAFEKKAKE
jgi:ABC-type Zn uptake system ZnuABC Zn-binding protein ZnuA